MPVLRGYAGGEDAEEAGEVGESEPHVDEALAIGHGLAPEEYARFVALIGRIPTFTELGIDVPFYSQRERPIDEVLPWDHIHIRFGREYLAKEQTRSFAQLEEMAGAV